MTIPSRVLLALFIAAGCGLASRSGPIASPDSHAGSLESIKRLDFEAVVAGSQHDIWQCWTTNAGIRSFLCQGSNIDLRMGGPYEILFDMSAPEGQRGSEGCTVLSYIPEEMLSFSWNAPPRFTHARTQRTFVVVRLEPLATDRTRVRLTHLGWDEQERAHPDHLQEWTAVREYFAQAWPFVLNALGKHFGQPSPTNSSTTRPSSPSGD